MTIALSHLNTITRPNVLSSSIEGLPLRPGSIARSAMGYYMVRYGCYLI
jgi:hypothetical protein